MIDGQGNYIVKGNSFKNSNFFEFYKSYNKTDCLRQSQLEAEFAARTGTMVMRNSKGEECLIAHSPVNSTEDWAIVSLIPMADLSDPALNIDIGCIRSGLIYTDAQGRVPMLPVFSPSYGMLVNEDIFAREGLAIPTTYSSFLDACEKLKAAGYAGPVITYNDSFLMCLPMVLPYFYATIQDNAEAVRALNAMEPSAGEYLRPALELAADFMSHGYVDMNECNALENNYQALILRFFEGDVPMIFVNGDTVSGTAKRESLSQAFTEHPFPYSFHPIPVTEKGCCFLNIVSMEFAVNKNSKQLDMANEFMRFLISTGELNELARVKRLLTTSTDFSHDGMYASFIEVDADHTIYEQDIGLQDPPIIQLRQAVWQVESGNMSIEDAIKAFGTLG